MRRPSHRARHQPRIRCPPSQPPRYNRPGAGTRGMDALSSIFTWLSDHEADVSAVAGITVLAGIVLAGLPE